MDKMRMESVDITAQNIEKIGTLFPNCITEMLDEEKSTPEQKVYKKGINFELLKQMLSSDVVDGDEAYEFTWVGKKAAIVEANKPICKTLRPCKEESVNWDTTENLYIEGDNLEVLKLLQESYLGKVKMIYIDPPYNTGSDFIYRDCFKQSTQEYEDDLGVYDEDGNRMFKNTDSNGRFHSDWCSMIYSRLMLARNLLADDGVIFISIDDNEINNIITIGDEVFGQENYIATFIWEKRKTRENRKIVSVRHDYVVCFTKMFESRADAIGLELMDEDAIGRYKNPDNDPRGVWTSVPAIAQGGHGTKSQFYTLTSPKGLQFDPPSGSCWRYTQEKMNEAIADNRIWFGSDGTGVPRIKKFLTEGKQGLTPETMLFADKIGTNDSAKRELVSLFEGTAVFETPKPASLLAHLVRITNNGKDGIFMDFFSGTATTAHAVMQLNAEDGGHRKFIMVQLPEPCDEKSEAYKAGYTNICEIGKERIRRAGAQILELSLENLEKEGVIEKYAGKLSEIRSLEEVYGTCGGNLSAAYEASEGGKLCSGRSDEACSSVDSVEYCGGAIARAEGIYPVFESGKGITCGTGDTIVDLRTLELLNAHGYRIKPESLGGNQQDALSSDKTSYREDLSSKISVLSSDHGFRVLKLDDTNMKDVYYAPADYDQNVLDMLESNIKEDRTAIDLLFECLLEWGLPLSLPYSSENIEGCTVHNYNDGDLIACFDENIPASVINTIAKRKPLRAVFRDSSFQSSPAKINVTQIFKELAPDTSVKVL